MLYLRCLISDNSLLDHVVIETEVTSSGLVFLCGSLEWISLIAQCDGVIDCLDASDEINCTYRWSGILI